MYLPVKSSYSVKKHLKHFATLFTHSQSFNDMFIVIKFRCCIGTFTNVCFTSFYIAANKEYLTNRQVIFGHVNSALSQLYCQKFSFKLANISRSCEENKTVLFVHSVAKHISHCIMHQRAGNLTF